MIRGVIFDMDGVLLDSMGIWNDLGVRYLRSKGITAEEGLGELLFSMSLEMGSAYLSEHYPLHLTPEQVGKEIEQTLEDYYFFEVPAKEGAGALMAFFREKGLAMTLATSSPRTHAEKALARNGLLPYIDTIFTSSETGTSKHTPEIYHLAAAYMGLTPAEVLVFEDSLYAIRTAKAAGYTVAGVYDADGEPDPAGVERESDLYLKKLTCFPKDFLR